MLTKVCTKCGEEKGLEFFHKSKASTDGRYPSCIECKNRQTKERLAKIAASVEYREGCKKPDACGSKVIGLCRSCASIKINEEFSEHKSKIMKHRMSNPEIRSFYVDCLAKGRTDPDAQKRKSESQKALFKDQEFMEAHKARGRERWAAVPKEERARLLEDARNSPNWLPAMREGIAKLHADPEYAALASERARTMNSDPEFRRKQAEATFLNPEWVKKAGDINRKLHSDPEFIEKHRDAIQGYWEFHHFEKRMEQEAAEWEAANQPTTEGDQH